MKKVLLSFVLISTVSFASPVATKDDIKELIKHMDKRFEQVDKRFEQVDKRFESMQLNFDKRLEQIDKRFEQVDKRFESMQTSMDKRFESMQTSMDNRFEDMMEFLFLLASGIFALITFSVWDRKTMIEKTKKEVKNETETIFDQKVDKDIVRHIIEALREMAKTNKEFNEILKKHHLSAN